MRKKRKRKRNKKKKKKKKRKRKKEKEKEKEKEKRHEQKTKNDFSPSTRFGDKKTTLVFFDGQKKPITACTIAPNFYFPITGNFSSLPLPFPDSTPLLSSSSLPPLLLFSSQVPPLSLPEMIKVSSGQLCSRIQPLC